MAQLNRGGLETVGALHMKTGIPKPTIVRLLQTLVAAGYVHRDEKTRGYHVTSGIRQLSSGFHGVARVLEVARPYADQLTKEILWPCAVCTLDLDAVVINYSTIADSPISPFHSSLGRRLSLGGRALGRAYVCFCPVEEQYILRNLMRSSEDPENSRMDDAAFEAMAAQARADGYTQRNSSLEPSSSGTIAMPIRSGGQVLATFGITYFRSALNLDQEGGRAQAKAAHPAGSAGNGFLSPKSVNFPALVEAMRSTVAQIEAKL
jgi:IclR family mhp operon transcriptional activator